jgi:hypothetical protein
MNKKSKYLVDIIKPPKKRRLEIPQLIFEPSPKKEKTQKKTFGIGLTIILTTILLVLIIYSLTFINFNKIFKNAFRGLMGMESSLKNENVFKGITDEFGAEIKEISESIGDFTSTGKALFQLLIDTEYLFNNGLLLALNKNGDLILEKLENLKNNFWEISATTSNFNNQLSEDIDFSRIRNFISALIDWLKTEPEQHLLIHLSSEDKSVEFYSDIMIKNASIVNIASKNIENKTTKFGGIITVNMSVIEEISQIAGLNFETQNFPEFFPQILEKIANAEEGLKSVIYGKISNAFKNREIEVYFPDESIQSFFDGLR